MKLIIFALILSIGITPAFASNHEVMSPYQQMKNGVEAEDVICKSGLALMIRQHGIPACVKESSVEKLAENMAWGFVAPKMEKKDDVEVTTDINKINGLNWYEPENRHLGFLNMDKLVSFPYEVSKGTGPVHEFGSVPHDLSKITIDYFGKEMSLGEYLEKSHTDAILVLKGNDIVYEEYFRMDSNERHSIQSISKTTVPAILGNYVDDGSIDLTKQTKEYIPDIGSGFAEATLQQVLNMDVSNHFNYDFSDPNAGIHDYEIAAGQKQDIDNKWSEGHRGYIKSEITGGDLTGIGVSQYEDPNTDIGAWVLEGFTGKKHQESFEENIYQHLGAEQDAMFVTDAQGNAFAAGGLQMTLRDFARYATVWMNEGIAPDGERVMSIEWINEIRDPTKGVPFNGFEDYNIRYHNQVKTDGAFLSHGGWGGQFMYADPENKVAYVMFSSLTVSSGVSYEDMKAMVDLGLAISESLSE